MVQPTCFADEVLEEHKIDAESAEELLKDITRANRKPNYPESVFFQQKMGWNEIAVRAELRRIHGVLRLQAIAGSEADRQAAQDECKTSADVLAKEEPKLTAKIAELQSKLEALQRDARLSQKRAEDQSDAVRQLKLPEALPKNVRDSVAVSVSEIENSIGHSVHESASRIHELECCLDPSRYRSESAYLEALRRSFRAAITDHVEGRSLSFRLSPEWSTIRAGLVTELAELQSSLVDMKAAHAVAIEVAERPLGFYVMAQPES